MVGLRPEERSVSAEESQISVRPLSADLKGRDRSPSCLTHKSPFASMERFRSASSCGRARAGASRHNAGSRRFGASRCGKLAASAQEQLLCRMGIALTVRRHSVAETREIGTGATDRGQLQAAGSEAPCMGERHSRLQRCERRAGLPGGVVPSESGSSRQRHRLSRGGDRQVNNAIYTIALFPPSTNPRRAPTRPTHLRGKDPSAKPCGRSSGTSLATCSSGPLRSPDS